MSTRISRQAFNTKMKLYARAGIPAAWLVNLPADTIEVYSTPVGGSYQQVRLFRCGDSITPQALPKTSFAVASILG